MTLHIISSHKGRITSERFVVPAEKITEEVSESEELVKQLFSHQVEGQQEEYAA